MDEQGRMIRNQRLRNADQAFSLYDHGDMDVVVSGGWAYRRLHASRTVLVRTDDGFEYLRFRVEFDPDSPAGEVLDAYYDTEEPHADALA